MASVKHEIADFKTDVIERSRTIPVLVDFWAEWCGPCRVLGPLLERLSEKSEGRWVLAKVDTDRNQQVAMQYGIRSIPSVMLFVDGEVADGFVGALPERAIVQWLEKALPGRYRKDIELAQQFLTEGRTEEARRLLGQVLEHDATSDHARTLLAATEVLAQPERAVERVKGIEEHSEHFPMAESVRTIAEFLGKLQHVEELPEDPVKGIYLQAVRDLSIGSFDASLEGFIRVVRENRGYDNDGARKACISIFRLLGEEHETTTRYRREFGSALNR